MNTLSASIGAAALVMNVAHAWPSTSNWNIPPLKKVDFHDLWCFDNRFEESANTVTAVDNLFDAVDQCVPMHSTRGVAGGNWEIHGCEEDVISMCDTMDCVTPDECAAVLEELPAIQNEIRDLATDMMACLSTNNYLLSAGLRAIAGHGRRRMLGGCPDGEPHSIIEWISLGFRYLANNDQTNAAIALEKAHELALLAPAKIESMNIDTYTGRTFDEMRPQYEAAARSHGGQTYWNTRFEEVVDRMWSRFLNPPHWKFDDLNNMRRATRDGIVHDVNTGDWFTDRY